MTGIIAQLGVFLVGAYFVLTGRGLTAGGVILFVNLMNFMIEPVTTLPALLAGRRAALGLMDQLADALAQHGTAAGQAELAPLTEGIRMEHVSFSYEPGTTSQRPSKRAKRMPLSAAAAAASPRC